MRVLVTGWFSFVNGEATAGDLLAMEVVCGWLSNAQVPYDVALSPVLGGGVDWEAVPTETYPHVLFVCGPARGWQLESLRDRFAASTLTLIDVSMFGESHTLADTAFERDGARGGRPDLAIASASERIPFVPVVRGHAQPEYGDLDGGSDASSVIDGALERHRLATVAVDTRVDPRLPGSRDTAEVEEVLARADAVLTSRLHGLVLALKHGVPALAIDPVHGGGKVLAQARTLDWPYALTLDAASPSAVDELLGRCLHPATRGLAADCRDHAVSAVADLEPEVLDALGVRPQRARPSGPG